MHYELLALGAAFCWACANLLSFEASEKLGAVAFVRIRLLFVSLSLWLLVWLLPSNTSPSGGLPYLPIDALLVMSLSAVIGLTIGDTALFAAFNRVGPRRANILFATNALFALMIGYVLLNEAITWGQLLASCLVIGGVMIAIFFGRRRQNQSAWEADRGSVGWGIFFGLLAAFCQALSAAILKPILDDGIDPIAVSAVRISVAGVLLYLLTPLQLRLLSERLPVLQEVMTWRLLLLTLSSGFFALTVGVTLLITALQYGNVGIVLVLSSVTPVLLLPMLWFVSRHPPAAGAWLGAILTVLGTVLLLLL